VGWVWWVWSALSALLALSALARIEAHSVSSHVVARDGNDLYAAPLTPGAPPAAARFRGGESRTFLFGYGSLLNDKSRDKTTKTGSAYPALVNGLQRSWGFRQQSRHMTALCAQLVEGAQTNGILVRVAPQDLAKFDKREFGYSRARLPVEDITPMSSDLKLGPGDAVWVYVVSEVHPPSAEYPIAQSYVDLALDGALKYGQEFANQFVTSTNLWKSEGEPGVHWVDDRAAPRIYSKGFVNSATVSMIDTVLHSAVEDAVKERSRPASA